MPGPQPLIRFASLKTAFLAARCGIREACDRGRAGMPWRDETSAQDCGCNGAAVPEGRHNLRAVPDWYTGGRASYRTVAQRPRIVPDFPDFLNSYRGGAVCRREATRSGGERVPPRTCVRGLLPRAAQAIACAAVLDLPCALPRVLPRASERAVRRQGCAVACLL